MIEMPRLMVDSSENDGKAEIVMDYVLSWCLRRADVICQNDNKPILYRYCRNMLALLCDKDLNDSIIFRGVRVWKEDQHIDLWVELIIENNGVADKHAILIENKYYSSLHDSKDSDGCYRNQLQVYKNRFDAHYNKILILGLNTTILLHVSKEMIQNFLLTMTSPNLLGLK